VIIRRKHTANYTALPNAVLTDERISIGARWCLAYLLSKPHDWQVQTADIQRVGGVGREKAQQMVRELIEAGWIKRISLRTGGGTFEGYEYVVSDSLEDLPEEAPAPETGKPATVKPATENPSLNKYGKKPNTEHTKAAGADERLQEFEGFWKAYPKRDGTNPKAPALKSFIRARSKASLEEIMEGLARYRKHLTDKGSIGTPYVKQAVTWLNQQGWEDFNSGGANALTDERRKELERILAS